ncbi:MAG: hypothetical protein M1814_004267 [Vezdaea aestivalis]|nr:MAG: hypothetical protein M1814_004267 [Vezdaea aestivalis]
MLFEKAFKTLTTSSLKEEYNLQFQTIKKDKTKGRAEIAQLDSWRIYNVTKVYKLGNHIAFLKKELEKIPASQMADLAFLERYKTGFCAFLRGIFQKAKTTQLETRIWERLARSKTILKTYLVQITELMTKANTLLSEREQVIAEQEHSVGDITHMHMKKKATVDDRRPKGPVYAARASLLQQVRSRVYTGKHESGVIDQRHLSCNHGQRRENLPGQNEFNLGEVSAIEDSELQICCEECHLDLWRGSLASDRAAIDGERIRIFAWPSRGGVIVHDNADGLDLDFLGLDRLNLTSVTQLDNRPAEDVFAARLLLTGAKWWDSRARWALLYDVGKETHDMERVQKQ